MTGAESVRERIFQEVREERARQDKKFGFRNSHTPKRWVVILMEEGGEVSNATLEHDLVNYYKEFIQVAGVAIAALESLSWQIAQGDSSKTIGGSNGRRA